MQEFFRIHNLNYLVILNFFPFYVPYLLPKGETIILIFQYISTTILTNILQKQVNILYSINEMRARNNLIKRIQFRRKYFIQKVLNCLRSAL